MNPTDFARKVRNSPAWYMRERTRAAVAHAERDVTYWRERWTSAPEATANYFDARDRERDALRAFNVWDGMVWSWVMRAGFDPEDTALFPPDAPIALDAYRW